MPCVYPDVLQDKNIYSFFHWDQYSCIALKYNVAGDAMTPNIGWDLHSFVFVKWILYLRKTWLRYEIKSHKSIEIERKSH